jgi:hypothetical protein
MLNAEQVRQILTTYHLTNADMARQLGCCSREAVRTIRQGLSYRNVCPEIPRWQARRHARATAEHDCRLCKHWRHGGCDLGFPDPIEDGLGFAKECSCYAPERNQAMSAA